MGYTLFSRRFVKRLACLVMAAAVFGYLLSTMLTYAAGVNDSSSGWAAPDKISMRYVGPAPGIQDSPAFLYDLDCTAVSYRLVSSDDMRTGCFTTTAFGMLDSNDDTVIFNGTDEGLPLLTYTAHQVLAPWPAAMDLLAFNPLSTSGAQIGLYTDPLNAMQDRRDASGQLVAKQLVRPPDMTLKDAYGRALVVNPQTLAYSEGGSWMAIETLSGSFVRINLATLDVKAFAPAYGSQGSSALLKSRVAVSGDGRFVAIANDVAAQLKVYDLSSCHGLVPNLSPRDLQPEDCATYDYWPFAARQVAGLKSVRKARFLNDGLLSLTVSSDQTSGGLYELAPHDNISSLTDYIGLGDSYTSGEGAFDYLAGTTGPDNNCHLSFNSYPLLISRTLFGQGGHSVACSGAVINDVGDTDDDYKGQVRGAADLRELEQYEPSVLESVETGFVPGYIAQQRFISRWQPAIATVSVGGNDVGFGDILQNCVEPHISLNRKGNDCYDTYEDRLELTNLVDRTVPRWTALYEQLLKEAPGMRLYVIGYPQIAIDDGNCADNVRLSQHELKFSKDLIDYLDSAIHKAADGAGATYVDISQALQGHCLCEAAGYDVAVNGLTAGDDAGPAGIRILGKESYHPNALGQSLIEQAILKQTHNLGGPVGDGGADEAGESELLDAPRTGRPINLLIPEDNLTVGAGERGSSVQLHASGTRDGLRPASSYSINMDGPAGKPLAVVASDSSGDVITNVTIPAGTIPGGHTIDVTGENEDGKTVDLTQPLYVAAGDADGDGDGIEDITDTCPAIINGGHDSDGDGIDDVCGGMVGAAGLSDAPTGPRGGTGHQGIAPSPQSGRADHGHGHGSTEGIAVTGRVTSLAFPANRKTTYGLLVLAVAVAAMILPLLGKINKKWRFWLQ